MSWKRGASQAVHVVAGTKSESLVAAVGIFGCVSGAGEHDQGLGRRRYQCHLRQKVTLALRQPTFVLPGMIQPHSNFPRKNLPPGETNHQTVGSILQWMYIVDFI